MRLEEKMEISYILILVIIPSLKYLWTELRFNLYKSISNFNLDKIVFAYKYEIVYNNIINKIIFDRNHDI